MKFTTVTLGFEDVEWIRPGDEVKDAVWTDEKFDRWLASRELLVALEEVSLLQRDVGNQLRRSRVFVFTNRGWAGSALRLVKKLKERRQQLRRMVRDVYGEAFLVSRIQSFDARHPRGVVA